MASDATSSVGARVEEIMASAQRAADDLQREVEDATARRAAEVRLAAETEAQRHLADARGRVDAFAEARIRRIVELTAELTAAAEGIAGRLGDAVEMRRQVDELISALGTAAQQAAREADRPPIRLPGIDEHQDAGTSEP